MAAPYYADDRVAVHAGDCLDVLRSLPDCSFDAVVTDPPYGLAELKPGVVARALAAWLAGDRDHVPDGRGFMGRSWDAFVPPPAVWDECLRVLKPGGHLLAFAGSRTADLMGVSVRLAGFEIRDTITWHYASGFPKSLDVSKAIDKARDDRADVLAVTGWLAARRDAAGLTNRDIDEAFGFSGMAGHWTAAPHLKIAQVPKWDQWEKLRSLLGFGDEMDAEVWRLNDRKGTLGEAWGQREVLGTRKVLPGVAFATTGPSELDVTAPATDAARQWSGWGTALKPASEPIIVARKPLAGTVAQTVLAHGTGALNIDACRVGIGEHVPGGGGLKGGATSRHEGWVRPSHENGRATEAHTSGRWPSNVVFSHAPECGPDDGAPCVEGCPVAELDAQSGVLRSGANPTRRGSDKFRDSYGEFKGQTECTPARGADEGGASRFFPTFRYQAKADTAERPRLAGVAHPTVKPLDLMRWLVRLVTPPGGRVLDPFAGSGTTAEACLLERVACTVIEREVAYLPLIVDRVTAHTDAVEHLSRRAAAGEATDLGLFAFLDGGAA
jgi:DNA modification methylase